MVQLPLIGSSQVRPSSFDNGRVREVTDASFEAGQDTARKVQYVPMRIAVRC